LLTNKPLLVLNADTMSRGLVHHRVTLQCRDTIHHRVTIKRSLSSTVLRLVQYYVGNYSCTSVSQRGRRLVGSLEIVWKH